ncbi:MAG: AAA family ATPase [Rhizobiales bacterium]|nr:AAA family ATPase [Hyphomicrobiales bacterium]
MATDSGRAPLQRLVIPFEDNRLLAALVGEFDRHLALIEDRLGVQAAARGNVITVTGSRERCDMARDVLQVLYRRLETGVMVSTGDVDGAIRHALAPSAATPGEGRDTAQLVGELAQVRTRKRIVTARTPMQSAYLKALERHELVIATGPAGTGKTYLAVAAAAARLEAGEVERIILSRPAVEAGERLGFLPGDMREKVDPYLRPLYDALYDVLPAEKVERGIDNQVIEIAPLAFMRGRTLSHAFVILDEAQNCTSMQMKMFLTRLGEGSRMVVTGDPTQVDLPPGQRSGLTEATERLRGIDEIAMVAFTGADVVRHALVAKIVAAYESDGTKR